MGRLLLLLLLIHLALAFAAVIDCLGAERRPERLPRFVWTLLSIFGLFGGPLAWFALGRPGRKLSSLWDASQHEQIAPDDDPEYLAEVARRAVLQRNLHRHIQRQRDRSRTADDAIGDASRDTAGGPARSSAGDTASDPVSDTTPEDNNPGTL